MSHLPRIIILSLMMVITTSLRAQWQINGSVKDQKKQPIESVTIVCKDQNGNILNFTRTGKSGSFVIKIKSEQPLYVLEITSIGYKKETLKISDISRVQHIILEVDAVPLKEISVRKRHTLKLRGDTLIYNPADFADKRDRSIEDVLRRMPGIEIMNNGQIKYNGKAISNFYIDGDNLLGGRYNIASQNIPHDAVDRVQVIEKDQPIKMLRDFNMSDDVALNIVIKDNARMRVMGVMRLGGGLPGKYDGSVTAMTFKKKLKFINNFKGNNTGVDPARDLNDLTFSDLMNSMNNSMSSNFLNAGTSGVPTLPQERTLRNQAFLANINQLVKFDDEWQMKINLSGLTDKRLLNYERSSETYLPSDTIRYTENQDNDIRPQSAFGKISLTGNAEKYYLKNDLSFEYKANKTNSNLLTNQIFAFQKLNREGTNFSNELTYRKKLKSKNTILLYSLIRKTTQPELLRIQPGLNEDLFNNGMPFSALVQSVRLPAFFTNNYAAKNFITGKFVHSYRIGFTSQTQRLSGALMKSDDSKVTELISDKYHNDLHWSQYKIFVTPTLEFKDSKITSTLSLPVNYNKISARDNSKDLDFHKKYFFIEPSLSIRYQTGIEHYVNINYNHNENPGGIDGIYRGVILRDYRSLMNNDGPLSESSTDRAGVIFNFKRTLKMFFFNIGGDYSVQHRNILSFSQLNDNISERVSMLFPNEVRNTHFGGGVSKYIFPLTTTLSGRIDYNVMQYLLYQNTFLLPFRNKSITFGSKVFSKISKWINLDYSIDYTTSTNRSLKQDLVSTTRQSTQDISISVMTIKNVYLTIAGQYLSTSQKGQPDIRYFFSDIKMKYRWVKTNTDIEFSILNLTNIKTFEALYVSANSFTRSSYVIPGLSVLGKIIFGF